MRIRKRGNNVCRKGKLSSIKENRERVRDGHHILPRRHQEDRVEEGVEKQDTHSSLHNSTFPFVRFVRFVLTQTRMAVKPGGGTYSLYSAMFTHKGERGPSVLDVASLRAPTLLCNEM